MNHLSRVIAAGLITAAAALAAAPSPATAAAVKGDYFVVETRSESPASTILDAGGSFDSCTSVTDLGGIAEQIGPRKWIFIGDKQVNCGADVVVIHYNAEQYGSSGKRTSGHWFIVTEESTLPGATEGFGTVRGDGTACTPAPDQFCIVDTFAGKTS
jgi:hypothetical protein